MVQDMSSTKRGSPAPDSALRCHDLHKRYGELVAVAGLDLEVLRGECFGLLGPNGAGKTTTLEMLEGLRRPDSGELELLGQRWGEGRDGALRARIGVQLQETQLPERLTVEETLRLFASFYPRGPSPRELLEQVELGSKRKAQVGTLSGGQRQRLALGCALAAEPELLFLDEPTTGLDPQARRRIWELVEAFRGRGGTVLLTTHSMEEAQRLCDRVAIVDRGRRVAVGSPGELIASLGAEQILDFDSEPELPEETLAALPGVARVLRRSHGRALSVSDIGQFLAALLQRLGAEGGRVTRLSSHEASLEDVFLHLTGRDLRDA